MTIFILHYKKLSRRKNYLLSRFENLNHNIIWVEEFDPEDISISDLDEYYSFNSVIYNRRLNINEISLWMKHHFCYKIIRDLPNDLFLILEDDVIFNNGIFNNISQMVLPQDYSICDLGNGCGLSPKNSPNEMFLSDVGKKTYPVYVDGCNFYSTDFGMRATDSYLITQSACDFLYNHKTINYPSDYHINSFNDNPLKIYWYYPSLFNQGSQNGTYESSIQ